MAIDALRQHVAENPEVNVTPLVDVMLALVVILLVAAPLATHRLPLPLGGSAPETVQRTLKLSVLSTGELYLDGAAVNRAQLAATLAAAAAAGTPPALELRPDATARYDDVAAVLALAEQNGATIRIEDRR
ncbi:MAG TPA: biopolymer transporter ExbD [Dokdonella sp.]